MPADTSKRARYSRFTEHDLLRSASPANPAQPHHDLRKLLGADVYTSSSSHFSHTPTTTKRPEVKRLRVQSSYSITPRISLLTMVVVVPTVGLAAAFFYALFHYRDHVADGCMKRFE